MLVEVQAYPGIGSNIPLRQVAGVKSPTAAAGSISARFLMAFLMFWQTILFGFGSLTSYEVHTISIE